MDLNGVNIETNDHSQIHHNHDNLHNHHAIQNDENKRNQEYLSWRKLLLSKAKLKAASTTSGLMSGFAMVEIQLDAPGGAALPPHLCILFSVLTTFLISV